MNFNETAHATNNFIFCNIYDEFMETFKLVPFLKFETIT